MSAATHRQDVAARFGLVGGVLGVVAGAVQALVGDRIPDWSGAKASPTGLGLLTVLLSVVAIRSAVALRRAEPTSPPRRAAATVGLVLPAALCFSTVGRLWYLPGVLLLIAAANVVAAGRIGDLRQAVSGNWLRVLLSVLGGFELLMAVAAAPVLTAAVGIVGGLALMAAPWVPAGSPRTAPADPGRDAAVHAADVVERRHASAGRPRPGDRRRCPTR